MSTIAQLGDQRKARQAIGVFQSIPNGYDDMGDISVRRCHRSFVEEAPTLAAFEGDLVLAAYAGGADAIANIRVERLNGLLANCWYVEEATASIYKKR